MLAGFRFNIKSGVCRVVLLCAPAPNNTFNYRAVRNLMQLMSFSEQSSSRYDLVLMDLREERGDLVSKIIWRRYSVLPQIPLIAESIRDTSAGIDKMKERESKLSSKLKLLLQKLLESLSGHGLMAIENTSGYALKSENSKKSIYTTVAIRDRGWVIVRHQIRPPESLYAKLETEEHIPTLDGLNTTIQSKGSTLGSGRLFEIELSPELSTSVDHLAQAIVELAKIE